MTYRPIDSGYAQDWEAILTAILELRDVGVLKPMVQQWIGDLKQCHLHMDHAEAVEQLIMESGITINHPRAVAAMRTIRLREPPRKQPTRHPLDDIRINHRVYPAGRSDIGTSWGN